MLESLIDRGGAPSRQASAATSSSSATRQLVDIADPDRLRDPPGVQPGALPRGRPAAGDGLAARGGADKVAIALGRAHVAGPHRTLMQDPVFAIDQLVEIAIRALSAAVNDTFTAI